MGYELSERTMLLRFRGTEFDGLEARARYPNVADYIAAMSTEEDRLALNAFGEHLLDWTVTQDGKPVPATPENVVKLPADLAYSLSSSWLRTSTKVVRDNPLSTAAEVVASNGAVEMETL